MIGDCHDAKSLVGLLWFRAFCALTRVLQRQGMPAARANRVGDGHGRAAPRRGSRFEHLVLDFLAYLEFERGLSRNTLEAYRSDLLQFGRFLDERELSALEASAG